MHPLPLPTEHKNDWLSLPPCVQIDKNLRILAVNDAAARAGVRQGEILPIRNAWEMKRLIDWYTHSVSEAKNSPFASLPEASILRVPLASFSSFRTALIRMEYSLADSFATVLLFRSQEELLRSPFYLSDRLKNVSALFTEHVYLLGEKCTDLFCTDTDRAQLTESVDSVLGAILLCTRLLSPITAESHREKRLFSLSRLLDTFLSEVLPAMHTADVRTEYSGDGADCLVSADTSVFFLLLGMLFTLMSALSADGILRISENHYARDGELRLSAVTAEALPPLSHISDLPALAALLPQHKAQLLAAEYLSALAQSYLEIFTEPETREITISLYIPYEKQEEDFKSPRGAEEDLYTACRCLRGFFAAQGELTAKG